MTQLKPLIINVGLEESEIYNYALNGTITTHCSCCHMRIQIKLSGLLTKPHLTPVIKLGESMGYATLPQRENVRSIK